jgi:nicotinate dehydrogenase subunit B
LVINPDGLVNQIEGGIVQSISWTLLAEVKWDRQQVFTRSWEVHPILPFSEVPTIEMVVIGAHDQPSTGSLRRASSSPSSLSFHSSYAGHASP